MKKSSMVDSGIGGPHGPAGLAQAEDMTINGGRRLVSLPHLFPVGPQV